MAEEQAVMDNPPQESNGTEQVEPKADDKAVDQTVLSGDESIKDDGKSTEGDNKPASYELTLPDGSELDENFVANIAEYAKENGLTQDQAQAQLTREAEAEDSFLKSHVDNIAEIRKGWQKEASEHPAYGGDKWETTKAQLNSMMNEHFNDKARQILNDSGLGDNPDIIEGFHRIALLDAEDKLEQGRKSVEPKSRKDTMYPSG